MMATLIGAVDASDAVLARYVRDVIAKANDCLKAKPLEHKLEGPAC